MAGTVGMYLMLQQSCQNMSSLGICLCLIAWHLLSVFILLHFLKTLKFPSRIMVFIYNQQQVSYTLLWWIDYTN